MPEIAPELAYRRAPKSQRRKLQAEVIEAYRPRVAALVRRTISGTQYWAEGEQVGLLGVLVALERYDDEISGPDRGSKSFWAFCFPYVRDEIRRWMAVGVYWRKDGNRGKGAKLEARRAYARLHRAWLSMDAPLLTQHRHGPHGDSLYDIVASSESTAADQAEHNENVARLLEFVATLTAAEKDSLFSEQAQLRHHSKLIDRARKWMTCKPGAQTLMNSAVTTVVRSKATETGSQ